jgi:hypothetical protein
MCEGSSSATSGRRINIGLIRDHKRKLQTLAAACAAALGAANAAQAATYTWNNSGTNWNAGASWGSSHFPGDGFSSNDLALFNTAAVNSPNIATSVSIARISFQTAGNGGYNITASPSQILTLTATTTIGNAITNSTNFIDTISAPITFSPSDANTQVISNGGTLTLSGPIIATAASGVRFAAAGTTMLTNGSNNFSGGIALNGGKVNVANDALGTTGNIQFTGGTLQYGSGNTLASSTAPARFPSTPTATP